MTGAWATCDSTSNESSDNSSNVGAATRVGRVRGAYREHGVHRGKGRINFNLTLLTIQKF